jgi:aminoglycoside 6'-N-acetyltransferase I
MAHALWSDGTAEDHGREFAALIEGRAPGKLPAILLVAQEPGGGLIGFVQAGLRSHADGCDPSQPVGYLEGWYVDPMHRRRGVGAQLVAAAEDWARSQGCREMASDTWIDNAPSQQAHAALGFEVVDRCVNYRKAL